MLADAFIPITPILPASQVALLVVIVVIEALVIRRFTSTALSATQLWASVIGANIVTTLIGVALVFPLSRFEFWLAYYGWDNEYGEHPLVWWLSYVVYAFALPYTFLLFCYVVSWRTEFALLTRWLAVSSTERVSLRSRTVLAHRISYGILAVPVIVVSVSYGWMVWHLHER
jgi:hypothetical protein